MSMKPRTIDDLGIKANERYAKDKQLFEPNFIEESRFIPQKASVSVLKPYVPLEFEQLFSSEKKISWAAFSPPPNYFEEANPLFSYQLIPSLGGYEKQENDEDKLETLQKISSDGDESEKERQTLISLFQCINHLDKTLTLINARRNQYQRG